MNLRRKKKLFLKILVFVLIAGGILGFFIFIYPKSSIPTYDKNDNEDEIKTVDVKSSNQNITLPTKIKTISPVNNTNNDDSNNNNNSNNTTGTDLNTTIPDNVVDQAVDSDKTYESYIDDSLPYLITVLSVNNKLTILLSDKSNSIIPEGSPTQTGHEYFAENMPGDIVSTYDFTVDGYTYPIILLLSSSGKVYYINTEEGYKTGVFKVSGMIENIPSIKNVYTVTVDKNYKSAILVGQDDVGYEFNLSMINK
ncbi:MAG: hypothetical protein IKG42_00950 [Clostridia bacterium]|nr:hypothetical protein [Clostridia bacterium]